MEEIKDKLLIAENQYYSMDCYETKRNNNVLVVGTSGAGKTRGIVIPNLLQGIGSYIVSDPKGSMYKKYKSYLISKGYEVDIIDFVTPEKSSVHYNPLSYIKKEQDIVKIANILNENSKAVGEQIFWSNASCLLLESIISYVIETHPKNEQCLGLVQQYVNMCDADTERIGPVKCPMDRLMQVHGNKYPDSFAVSQYNSFKVAAAKTLKSILIVTNAFLGQYHSKELKVMLEGESYDFAELGCKKKVLFVVVSDNDRTLDPLVNIFFTQAMNELCLYADTCCEDNKLQVPVRFIMDDFATNCKIDDFPRMISSIRSRGISTMLMIQSEAQLLESYNKDSQTIISNCDTYVYLGGNDIQTAREISERCDLPLTRILCMPIGSNWIFRRGEQPVNSVNIDLDTYLEWINYTETIEETSL